VTSKKLRKEGRLQIRLGKRMDRNCQGGGRKREKEQIRVGVTVHQPAKNGVSEDVRVDGTGV